MLKLVLELYLCLRLKVYNEISINYLKQLIDLTIMNMEYFVMLNDLEINLNTNKIHKLKHFPYFITLFGPPLYYSTQSWEATHKMYCKNPYKNTSKKNDTGIHELMIKMQYILSAVLLKKERSRLLMDMFTKPWQPHTRPIADIRPI